ncbi:MAG: hypothetical protein ACRDZ8_18650 [Acidimicrobiales bacterium]
MDSRPAPDPAKLLSQWMEWERGEETPGRVMANLKTGGLRDLLEDLAATGVVGVDGVVDAPPGEAAAAVWTPVV